MGDFRVGPDGRCFVCDAAEGEEHVVERHIEAFKGPVKPRFEPKIVAAPGTTPDAPCKEPCSHEGCLAQRATASRPCAGCAERVGFDEPYCVVGDRLAHEKCLIGIGTALRGAA
jgi:hypothetical protein